MVEPEFKKVFKRSVSHISRSGNPIVIDDEWDKKVVVFTDDDTDISEGDDIKFVIHKHGSDHYQALLSHQSPVKSTNYRSKPNIPIHHDGQSAGKTRSESHAFRSVDDRY